MGTRITRPSEMNAKYFQCNAVTGDGMFHRAKRVKFCWRKAENFFGSVLPSSVLRLGEPRSDLNIRKFPQVRVNDPGGPLADKETSVSLNHKGDETSRGGGFAFAQIRQFPDAAFAKRDAELFDRANFAPRISRCANQRAKFHEGLVKVRASRIVLVLHSRPRMGT